MRGQALAALTLAWAKESHPDAYGATLAVSGDPVKFRAYMARLVELRYEADPGSVPMWALEETSISIRMRTKQGREITVAGKRATGERTWGFAELAQMLEAGVKDLDEWADTKDRLDLVLDDGQFAAADRAAERERQGVERQRVERVEKPPRKQSPKNEQGGLEI